TGSIRRGNRPGSAGAVTKKKARTVAAARGASAPTAATAWDGMGEVLGVIAGNGAGMARRPQATRTVMRPITMPRTCMGALIAQHPLRLQEAPGAAGLAKSCQPAAEGRPRFWRNPRLRLLRQHLFGAVAAQPLALRHGLPDRRKLALRLLQNVQRFGF